MKKILTFLLLLLTYCAQAQSGYAVISATDVNFRTQPDTKAELISKVQLGTLAKVLTEPTETKNWYKLQIGSKTGWISADYVFDLIPLDSVDKFAVAYKRYKPYLAMSRIEQSMGRYDNFLVMTEDENLTVNAKVYPVKIINPGQGYILENYRNTFLSLTSAPGGVDLIHCHEISDGTVTLSFYYAYIYYGLLVFEIKPKITEGFFEARLKYYYHKMHDE
jgi:hypothetical protein